VVGANLSRHEPVGNALHASRVAPFALFAEWLTTRPLTEVFGLNVVAGIAFGVVVVDILFDGMPRSLFRHGWCFPFWKTRGLPGSERRVILL
jgi:hypothetical protein